MDAVLLEKIDNLPQSPGVYIMSDRRGTIIYVGKAINLRNRVRSYLNGSDPRAFVRILDQILGDLDVVLTRTEKEALLLENELIKKHRPRFNVVLKDDKNFISLRLDVKAPYPRLEVVRKPRDDGARYFGPYASASAIRETLRVVNRHFHLRTCTDSVMANRRRPCLQYQIKRCPGPCVLPVPPGQYRRSVDDVSLFLQGRTDTLTEALKDRMRSAAREQRFEDAAVWRDQLQAITRSLEKQQMVDTERGDQDAWALFREGPQLVIQLLYIRDGRLQGGRHFPFGGQEFPDAELLTGFLTQYYAQSGAIPDEVLLPLELEDTVALEDWLSEQKNRKVRVLVPQRGDKVRLVEMARENAEHHFKDWRRQRNTADEVLEGLQTRLRLTRRPRRIECFDNSHLQGTLSVGSRVCFIDGEPDTSQYRHYKVRLAAGDDDFQMMREVLTRRLSRGLLDDDLPDLIVVDGGKGQLQVAQYVLETLQLTDRVDLCSLAKSRVVDDERLFAARQGFTPEEFKVESTPEGGGGNETAVSASPLRGRGKSRNPGRYKDSAVERSPERVFLPGQKNPIVLRANSAELFLLQRLRDEAHRVAITFQRNLRRAASLRSILREIPGVGAVRQRALLRHFGSLRKVREASAADIAQVEGFSDKLAADVWRFFQSEGSQPREERAPGRGGDPESERTGDGAEAELAELEASAPAEDPDVGAAGESDPEDGSWLESWADDENAPTRE